MHARIENGQVVEYPILNLSQRLPNSSLPSDLSNDAGLPDGFVYVAPSAPPQYNPSTHKVIPGQPVRSGAKWVSGWTVQPLSPQEITERDSAQAAQVRAERNARLAACDWTQVADAPVDKTAWATYRQALRDVTSQAGFPFDVTWPVEPAV